MFKVEQRDETCFDIQQSGRDGTWIPVTSFETEAECYAYIKGRRDEAGEK